MLQNLPNLFQLLGLAGVINLRENPSSISSMVLLLGLISRFSTNEQRVATNAPKRLRIDYDSVMMSKNALGIRYESRTMFRIREFVAKVLNSSKLLSRVLCLLCLCASVYMCLVVTCWERADLLAPLSNFEFVTLPLVSWVRCGT